MPAAQIQLSRTASSSSQDDIKKKSKSSSRKGKNPTPVESDSDSESTDTTESSESDSDSSETSTSDEQPTDSKQSRALVSASRRRKAAMAKRNRRVVEELTAKYYEDDATGSDNDFGNEKNNSRRQSSHEKATLTSLQRQLEQIQSQLKGKSHDKQEPIESKSKGKPLAQDKNTSYKRVDWVVDRRTMEFTLKSTKTSKDAQFKGYAFYVRRHFNHRDDFEGRFLEIKAPLLRDALRKIVGDVRGMDLFTEEPRIDPDLLFLYKDDIIDFYGKVQKTKPTGSTKTERRESRKLQKLQVKQLKSLVAYFDEDYKETAEKLASMLARGVITFDLFWALWKPGTYIFSSLYGNDDDCRVFLLETACKRTTFLGGQDYHIDGTHLDYNGRKFIYNSTEVVIKEFQGVRRITSLPCYPLKYHASEEEVRKNLIERGNKFLSLCGVHYKSYSGMAYYRKKDDVVKYNVQPSRIMIDSATFRRVNGNYGYTSVRTPLGAVRKLLRAVDYGSDASQDEDSDTVESDRTKLESFEDDCDAEGAAKEEQGKPKRRWTDDDRLIASPVVLGFSFSDKIWLEFAVSSVTEIKWNDEAWDSLVMEPKTKDMIHALVTARKFRSSETIDDVIQGKGKGLVSVLHGPPGTGKTLTAEGISELLKCPLYAVSAGELGTDARSLEIDLQRILDISHTWGAILLLDEADVFLEMRNMQDVHRNSLVSIFLRQLEYFQGILFLTTNRVETFDDAFRSRIHIALRYETLEASAKKSIFRMFLKKVSAHGTMKMQEFTDDDYNTLAKHDLNGREIKNAVASAQDLALNKGEQLCMKHIQQVLEVHAKFRQDLKGGTGFEDAMRSYC